MSGDVGAEVAAVLAAHWEIDVENGGDQTEFFCDGCKATLLVGTGDADAAHLAHVADALAPLIAVRVEAAKAEALRPFEELFGGGPDTPCRTVWRRTDPTGYGDTIECVEVPMDDLRAAFDRDPEATP